MASRRGANEGSVYRRKDGRWAAVLNLGYGGGKRQRKTFYAATRQEVASRLAAAVRDHQLGKAPVPEREKLGDFLQKWLEDVAKHSVRASTYRGYEVLLRLHIIPEIGHLKLARLAPSDLDGLYSRLLAKLSPKTVKMAHAVIHRALSHAQKRGAVAVNVASIVDAPSVPRKEFRTLSPAEAARLLATARPDRFYGLYVLALNTGMRQAELLGLRWRDVDLSGAVLHVRQQVYRLNGEWVFIEPKTAAGRRTISLSAACVEALRSHRARQLEERLGVGAEWEDNDLVFSNRLGRPMAKENLLRWSFWPLLEKANLPHVRFHDLRHSCASMLLAANVNPKVVQEMLGHSSIAVTMDTYSHSMPSLQEAAAEKLSGLLAASS
jgi:integrase